MKKTNKNIYFLIIPLAVITFGLFTLVASAQPANSSDTATSPMVPVNNVPGQNLPPNSSNTGNGNSFYLQNPLRFNSVGGIIQGFLEILSYLVVLFAVLMLIWTGLQFILAQGNSDRLKELKNQLLWIIVGVAIVIGARIIVTVVIRTLETTGVVSPNVIESANNAVGGN